MLSQASPDFASSDKPEKVDETALQMTVFPEKLGI
jgi:hypothetical protein